MAESNEKISKQIDSAFQQSKLREKFKEIIKYLIQQVFG